MVTVRAGGALASVKAAKEYRAEIGERVALSVDPSICHLFETDTGRRVEVGR